MRLNLALPKLCEDLDGEVVQILIRGQLRRDQPGGESIAIRSRRFTEPQFLADLCAVQFNGVALPVVLAKEG